MQLSRYTLSLFLFILLNLTAQAQTFSPLTVDFRVDADPPSSSGAHSPAIAVNQQNTVMIVWAEEIRPQRTKVYGRIYNPRGEAQTNEFRIDQSTDEVSSVSGRIDIATDVAGNFYIVWEDSRKLRDYQIFGRVYSPEGKALTGEFVMDEDTVATTTAREPAIAISSKDILAISWVRNSANVMAKFYQIAAPGELTLLQPAQQIDRNTRNEPLGKDPRIRCTPDDEFVITWVDNRYEYAINQGTPLVYARQFSPEGKILGNDFIVNADLPKQFINCSAPNVIIDGQKNLYFCWNDGRSFEQLNSNMIYARAFTWEQQPLTGDVPVSRCILGDRPGMTLSPDDSIQIYYSQFIDTMTDPGKTFSHIFLQTVGRELNQIDYPVQIDQGGTVDIETRFDVAMNETGWVFTSWIQNTILDSLNFEMSGHVYFNVFAKGGIPAPYNLQAVEVGIDRVQWAWEWFESSEYQMDFYFKNEDAEIISPVLPADTRSWLEEGLAPNQRLVRNVYASRFSQESFPSNTAIVYTRCNAPTNLTATQITQSTVNLSWEGFATRFAIERASDAAGKPGQWLQIVSWTDSLTSNRFTDTQLTPLTTYWYRVGAYNGDGLLSATTSPFVVTTREEAPLPPILFSGKTDSDSSILWSWQDQADDEVGFRLEDELGEPVAEPLPENTTQFLETQLNGNQTYHRRVRAIGATGTVSAPSGYDSVTTLAAPPTRFRVTDSSETTISLSWNSGNATAFRLQRAVSQDGAPGIWKTLLDWSDQFSLLEYTDPELSQNTTYWYQINSYNKLGQINAAGTQVQASTLRFFGPSNFRGIAIGPTEIRWTWRDNSENEIGYQILTQTGEIVSAVLDPDQTSWTESELSPNQKLIRFVQVFLPDQSVYNSNLDSVFTLVFPPENLVARDSTSTSATLAWTGNGATRFAVERTKYDPNQSLLWEIIQDWTDRLTESRFEDTGLLPQNQYLYRVRGYNGDQMQTEPSNTVLVSTPASILEPPTNLYGQAVSSTQINWFWTDNTSQEIAYRLKDEENRKITTDFPANTVNWTESGLQRNTRYGRQVFAVNANDAESGGSNLAFRYTLAVAPSNLTVTRQPNSTRLAWHGHGSSRFSVERANDIDGTPAQWVLIAQNLTDSTYDDVKLPVDRGYWFHVLAYNGDSIRTQPGEAVLLPPMPLMRGDLNQTSGLDFGDLDRLIEIVLEQGDSPNAREMYAANFYELDENINIHDIIALVDTLLRLPELFKPAETSLAQIAPVKVNRLTSENEATRLSVSFTGCPDFNILALEFSIANAKAVRIEPGVEEGAFNLASFKSAEKYRVVAYRRRSVAAKLTDLELQVRTDEAAELTLENVLVVEPKKTETFLPVLSEKISLSAEILPEQFQLQQNYPNPFNATTEIRFFCPEAAKVTLEIYNLMGQKVKTLIRQARIHGWKKIKWDATDANGIPVGSGIYLYKLTINAKIFTRKLILIR